MPIRRIPRTDRTGGLPARLNAAHPLARQLVHGYVFSDGAGGSENMALPRVVAAPNNGAFWTGNSTGPAIRTTGGSIDAGISTVIPQPPFHIVVGFANASNSGEDFQGLVLNILDGSAYSNAAWGLSFGFRPTGSIWSSDGNAAYSGGTPGSDLSWADSSSEIYAAGSAHHLHLACEPTGSTLYRNGVSLGTAGVAIPGVTANPLSFGGNLFQWMQFNADFQYAYIFSGSLSARDIEDLRADPYALVEPDAVFDSFPVPTRFYFPSTGTPAITPAFDAAWDDTSNAVRRPASTTKGSTTLTEAAGAEVSTSNTWDMAFGQFVSEPLEAQTISGTVRGVFRARESNAGANARSQIVVRVVSADGSTVRGTLLAQNNTTTNINEWVVTATPTSARNAYFPVGASTGSALTSVTAQAGDRLVIEVGGRAVNTVATSYTLGMWFGDDIFDAVENETATTASAPWLEFSNQIAFQAPASPITADAVGVLPKFTSLAAGTETAPTFTAGVIGVAPKFTSLAAATRTIPDRTATALGVAPKFTALAAASVIPPARTASAIGVAPKFSTSATASAAAPGRTAAAVGVLPKFGALAAATRTIPNRTAAAVGVAPKFGSLASALRTIPDRTATSASTAPKFSALAAATRTIPNRTATAIGVTPKFATVASTVAGIPGRTADATGVLPKFGSLGAAVRTISNRTADATGTLPKFSALAAAARTIPARTAAATGVAPKFTATASAQAAAPGFSASSASVLPKFAGLGTASRTIPARTSTAAATLPKFAASAAASRTIPVRTAASAGTLPKFAASASGLRLAPGTAASAATLPKFTVSTSATHAILPRGGTASAALRGFGGSAAAAAKAPASGTVTGLLRPFGSAAAGEARVPGTGASAARLPKFTTTASATRGIPNRTASGLGRMPKFTASAETAFVPLPAVASSASSLKPFGSRAAAIRLPVPVTSESSATLPLFRVLATSTALTPVFTGPSAIRLPGFSAIAEASATVPVFEGSSAAAMPRFGSQTAARFVSLDAADIVVREYLTARIARTDRIGVTAVRRHTVAAPVRRLAKITARTRTP